MKYSKKVFALSMVVFLSFSSIISGYGSNETKIVNSDSRIMPQASYKTNDMVILNEDSNGKEIVMTRGQMIKLSLKQDDDTYWSMVKNMDTSVLQNTFSYTTQEPGKIMNEVFKTIGEGTSVIEFSYLSSKTYSILGSFKVTITVKQPDGMIVADESFDRKEVVLKKGDKLKAAFYCFPGSYYPSSNKLSDNSIIKEIESYSVGFPLEPYPVATGGRFGYQYYVYEAVGVGTTDIRFGYPNRDSYTKFTIKVIDDVQEPSYKTNDLVILNEDSSGKDLVMTRGQMIKMSLKQDDDKYWAMAKNMNPSVLHNNFSYTTQEPEKIINEVFKTIGEGTSVIEFGYFSLATNKQVGNFKVSITVKQQDGIIVVDESFNGKEVVLKKGDKLKAAYFCIPGSLYPSCINEPDSSILNEIDDYSLRCPLDPYPVATGGGFGYKYFVYEAIGVGTTGLRFGFPNRDSDTKFTVKVIDDVQTTPTKKPSSIYDADNDGVISMADIMPIAKRFGTVVGDPLYDERYDFNKDGAINMADVIMIAKVFGSIIESYPEIKPTHPSDINF